MTIVHNIVEVKSADYNGTDFDGSPFNHTPDWLRPLMARGTLRIAKSNTDYAVFAIREGKTSELYARNENEPTELWPGDWLVKLDDGVHIVKYEFIKKYNQINLLSTLRLKLREAFSSVEELKDFIKKNG